MTEFKKWHDKKIKPHLPVSRVKRPGISKVFQEAREETWQAALEWIYEYMKKQEPIAPYFDYVLFDKIEKELESLTQSNNQSDNSSKSNSPS